MMKLFSKICSLIKNIHPNRGLFRNDPNLKMTFSSGTGEKYEGPWNFSWIIPTFLAGSSCPHTTENLKFLKQQGIFHLVTLSPEFRPPDTNFPGIEWSYIPIEEFEAPTLEDMIKFIDICEKERERKRALAIHCRAGRGRTGTMAACYLVHFMDMSPQSAITKIRMMRPGSVETYAQEKAVSQYRDYLRTRQK